MAGDLSDLKNLENFASSILGNVSPTIQVNKILALHANNQTKIIFEQDDPKQFNCAVLINNAGSLGNKIKSLPNHTDVDEICKYMDFNISSSFYLT